MRLPGLLLAILSFAVLLAPAVRAADDALALHAALTPEQAAGVDEKMLVMTLPEQVSRDADVEILAVSLGTLRYPPDAVQGLLADIASYPSWLTLNPSYKAVRESGSAGFVADIGSARQRAVRHSLPYDVETSGATTKWKITKAGYPLLPGSYVSFEAVPHPTVPGATLVVHRQLVVLPGKGRMTKYLTKENDEGTMKYWQDANKHARRTHWAMASALEHPVGEERKLAFIGHHKREFGSETLPLWAE